MQLHKFFYQTRGLPAQYDDKGKLTLDDGALSVLGQVSTDPALACLLNIREAKKALDYIRVPLSPRGCVHPVYLPRAKDKEELRKGMAGTGRPQASDPNIMQVPKEVRQMYIPHHPGHILFEYDFDQAELRVMAALANDSGLAAALEGDVHQYHAELWGCDRDTAKTVTYAVMYGAGPRKLRKTLAIRGIKKSEADCRALLDAFFSTNQGVKLYREELIERVSRDRCLRNPFGRQRYFWSPKRDIPAALDFFPQSTVADMLWASIRPVAALAREQGGNLLTIVHDSFLVELPEGADAMPIYDALTRKYDNIAPGFSLPVKIKGGPNWGTLQRVDLCLPKTSNAA
jgi:DNA polymerase I-like protein with 3'-5' exonuclease and polymerase domains